MSRQTAWNTVQRIALLQRSATLAHDENAEKAVSEAVGGNGMKTRIYISGGITGVDDYMERFAKAQKELEAQGYSVLNPALFNSIMPEDTTYEEYMKMSFTMLDMADAVYFLKGWDKSMGANREYGYALANDKILLFE